MKTSVVAVAALSVLGSLAFLSQGRQGGQVGDPKTPVFWSAQQMKDLDARAAARVSRPNLERQTRRSD